MKTKEIQMSNEMIRKMLLDAAGEACHNELVTYIEYENFLLDPNSRTAYGSDKPARLYVLELDIGEESHYLINEDSSELIKAFVNWLDGNNCLMVYNSQVYDTSGRVIYSAILLFPKRCFMNKVVSVVGLKRYIADTTSTKVNTDKHSMSSKTDHVSNSKAISQSIRAAITNQDTLVKNTTIVSGFSNIERQMGSVSKPVYIHVHDYFQPLLTIEEFKTLAGLYSPNDKLLKLIQDQCGDSVDNQGCGCGL